jgi:RHS repeat-associated protein
VNESRGYNSRLQLTSFNGVSYGYGASNNGRIASESVSGETVVYQYDELNRLMRAETQGDVWGQEFIYDGFGNLTDKRVTKGSAPSLSVPVDGNTNRAIGFAYDANGNQLWTNTQTLSYDYDNRIAWVDNRNNTGRMYGYDADNRRVYEADWTLVDGTAVFGQQAVHFWGVTGQRMGSYWLAMDGGQPPYYGPSVTLTVKSDRVYFGARLLKGETGWSGEDRLGSVGQFYPYGEARVGDPKRFATYEREGGGLDYAVNRYYWVGTGRFMTPDPYLANSGGAGDVADPGSWNRYSYVGGDPVNYFDPTGLQGCIPDVSLSLMIGIDVGLGCLERSAPVPMIALVPMVPLTFALMMEDLGTLDALVAQGALEGYSVGSDGLQLSFTQAVPWPAIALCAAQPQICLITAGVITIYIAAPVIKDIVGAIARSFLDKPRPGGPCVFMGETPPRNGFKTCMYRCPGYGAIMTVPCAADKTCPPVNANGWVVTW